jgi:hypothetical protein
MESRKIAEVNSSLRGITKLSAQEWPRFDMGNQG